jgi:carbon storage regulator
MLGDDVEIEVLEVQGEQVRLGVRAPRSLRILRKEIYTAVDTENKAAASMGLPEGLPEMKTKSVSQETEVLSGISQFLAIPKNEEAK